MINVIKRKEYVSVSGNAIEVSMFYCFWQTYVWPEWVKYDKMDKTKDLGKECLNVINEIQRSGKIMLSNDGVYQKAVDNALDQFTKLGISLQITDHT